MICIWTKRLNVCLTWFPIIEPTFIKDHVFKTFMQKTHAIIILQCFVALHKTFRTWFSNIYLIYLILKQLINLTTSCIKIANIATIEFWKTMGNMTRKINWQKPGHGVYCLASNMLQLLHLSFSGIQCSCETWQAE